MNKTNFQVEMYRANFNKYFPSLKWIRNYHWHDELQFTLVTKGTAVVQVNSKKYGLNIGEAIFINGGLIHSVVDLSNDGEYVSFCFPYGEDVKFSVSEIHKDEKWQCEALEILTELEKTFSELTEDVICGKIDEFCKIVIANCGNAVTESAESMDKHDKMKTMLTYIFQNYDKPIKVQNVIEYAGIEMPECCSLFREVFDTKSVEYLNEYRAFNSFVLMYSDYVYMEKFAEKLGFVHPSEFSKAFRKMTGYSPSEFRMRSLPKKDLGVPDAISRRGTIKRSIYRKQLF